MYRRNLSPQQEKVYNFVKSSILSSGITPTVREIAEGVGYKSPSSVHAALRDLEEMGYLKIGRGKSRRISLSDLGDAGFPKRTLSVPLLYEIADADDLFNPDAADGYVAYEPPEDAPEGRRFAVRITDDSMRDALLRAGDVLVVRAASEAKPGQIVVSLLSDGIFVSEYSLYGDDSVCLRKRDGVSFGRIVGKDDAGVVGVAECVIRKL